MIILVILSLFSSLFQSKFDQNQNKLKSFQTIANQIASRIQFKQYSVKTKQGINTDCLKAIITSDNKQIGVFHSNIQQRQTGYNGLYFGININNKWSKISKLSERGSQGYIYQIGTTNSYLILYQLQNQQKGNTIAIRYYESLQKIYINNFLYQYQIIQNVSNQKVRNIGTPSIDNITLIKKQNQIKYNQWVLYIKFHYSPDGSHDQPGYGFVNLKPLRDFLKNNVWIGGCKQNYSDWNGKKDANVQLAFQKIGFVGKIGQRDMFVLKQNGFQRRYYIYQSNQNKQFKWQNWRIILYSQDINRAILIPLNIEGVIDFANPHISKITIYNNNYIFLISFFIPSEGIVPHTSVTAGPFTAQVTITP